MQGSEGCEAAKAERQRTMQDSEGCKTAKDAKQQWTADNIILYVPGNGDSSKLQHIDFSCFRSSTNQQTLPATKMCIQSQRQTSTVTFTTFLNNSFCSCLSTLGDLVFCQIISYISYYSWLFFKQCRVFRASTNGKIHGLRINENIGMTRCVIVKKSYIFVCSTHFSQSPPLRTDKYKIMSRAF